MTVFVPRWTHWQPELEAGPQALSRTSKTSKTQLSSTAKTSESATSPDMPRQISEAGKATQGEALTEMVSHLPSSDSETPPTSRTSKTSKTPRRREQPANGAREAFDEIAEMPLEAFAEAGLIVTVWSDVLNREVLFVSDNVPNKAIEGRNLVVYRAADLANLAQARPTPGALRFVHEVKAVFGGTIRTTTADQEEAP